MIQGATNTANIGAMPCYEDDIGTPVDLIDDLDDNNLATL
jgi:hypothetical protein